jgi:hypothetical protein
MFEWSSDLRPLLDANSAFDPFLFFAHGDQDARGDDHDRVHARRLSDRTDAPAQHLGANAVIGVRYDATEIMSGVSEVLCYGTAVIVEPVEEV